VKKKKKENQLRWKSCNGLRPCQLKAKNKREPPAIGRRGQGMLRRGNFGVDISISRCGCDEKGLFVVN